MPLGEGLRSHDPHQALIPIKEGGCGQGQLCGQCEQSQGPQHTKRHIRTPQMPGAQGQGQLTCWERSLGIL